MGSFVNSSNTNRNILGKKETQQIYLQFVPGTVIDVVTSYESAPYANVRDINAIIAKSHLTSDVNYKSTTTTRYYPLFRGIVDVPTKGDPVLLCTISGINYYLGPLNTMNNPNFNLDTMNISDFNLGNNVGKKSFKDKSNLSKNYSIVPFSRIQKLYNEDLDNPNKNKKGYRDIHGDMMLEGRHGNSIRLGSRNVNPYIIFSNGRSPSNIVESTNDSTILAILDSGTLHQNFIKDSKNENGKILQSPFILSSDDRDGANRLLGGDMFDYNYNKSQTLLSSGKVTINSKETNTTISSAVNTLIGSGNETHIISEKSTTIEALNIFMGRQAIDKTEPLVLGTKLKDFLQEFVELFMKSHALVQGIPVPITDSTAAPLLPQMQQLLNKLSTPEFWSDYHYIEENGQKPE